MFARTKRLTLRPGWPEDAPALTRAIGHPHVVDKLARAPWPYALGDAQAFLSNPRPIDSPGFLMFESPAGTPRLIGGIGIQPGEAPGQYDLGYWITPDAWGRGYATEAGLQVVQIARHALGLKRLHAFHFIDNPASGRVLAKLGFRPTGRVEPRHSLARGGMASSAMLELDLEDGQGCDELMAA